VRPNASEVQTNPPNATPMRAESSKRCIKWARSSHRVNLNTRLHCDGHSRLVGVRNVGGEVGDRPRASKIIALYLIASGCFNEVNLTVVLDPLNGDGYVQGLTKVNYRPDNRLSALAVVGIFVLCWIVSTVVYRAKGYDSLQIERS
jgi:hypothetical protein